MKVPIYFDPEFVNNRTSRILEIVNYIYPRMNQLHGFEYSYRFWLRILHDFVKICLNREELLFEESNKRKKLFLPINSRKIPTSQQIIKNLVLYYGRKLLKGESRKDFFKAIDRNVNICLGTRAEELYRNNIGGYSREHYPSCLFSSNRKVRLKLESMAEKEIDPFISSLLFSLPSYYVEHFSHLINSIPIIDPPQKAFHYEHLQSPYSNLVIAKYQEYGSEIYFYQTGGFVGELCISPNKIIYETVDHLITYGWKNHPKDLPGRAYRLEEYYRNWREVRSKLKHTKFDCLVVFSVVDEYTREYYKSFYNYFIENINRNQIKSILLRPRPRSKYVNNKKELAFLDISEDVQIDSSKKSMFESAANSKIIIQPQLPTTNFLECLFCEQPVLAINTNKFPSDFVKPLYERLEKLQVIHPDVKSLVNHLNSVDINEWWTKVIKDDAFLEFGKKFAGFQYKDM